MEIRVVSTKPSSQSTPPIKALSRVRTTSVAVSDAIPRRFTFLGQTVPWDPGDTAIRRFSEPAVDSTKARLHHQISSARTAYAKALVSLHASSKNADLKALVQNSTHEDVAKLARDLDTASSAESPGPVAGLINVLDHYHGVFDILSQADFSYLPMIWGVMKLILIFAKNRSELLEKLTEMLVKTGRTLSRIQIYARLFPTESVLRLASDLYAAVLDFLQEVVTTLQRGAMRKFFSSIIRPFEEKYGRLVERIKRIEEEIREDGFLLQCLQVASLSHQRFDTHLQGFAFHDALNNLPPGNDPRILVEAKATLFLGFEHQATYHESLKATYSATAGPEWEKWFKKEQKYLPSVMALKTRTRLVQGLCDAPDFQHALQWAQLQAAESPEVPWAFLIWAHGMTAHSAIASLIYQLLQQRPTVIHEHNLDTRAFERANDSITELWNMFVFLMRVLGGCAIYISIGSNGPEEFAIVAKFVKTVREWNSIPIRVTIIHPYHEKFVLADNVTEIDGAYDVPPELTTTDALQHVLMPELGLRDISKTIRTVLWDSLWRETRYAVIGVALIQLLDEVKKMADALSLQEDSEKRELWTAGVEAWFDDDVCTNNVRELIQRHVDIVPLEPADAMRSRLAQSLKRTVLPVDADEAAKEKLRNQKLTSTQRDHIWDRMQDAIRPGTKAMFCGTLLEALSTALERFVETDVDDGDTRSAKKVVRRLLDQAFGRDGIWKESLSLDQDLISEGIATAIETGFRDIIEVFIGEQGTSKD